MTRHRARSYIHTKATVAKAAATIPAALLAASPLIAASQPVTDDEVAAAVEREYLIDSAVPKSSIEVYVQDGVVTLDGEVTTLAARSQAEDLAGIVRGVRSVVNRLRLVPTRKTSGQLREDVITALRADPVAEAYEITVQTDSQARVILSGTVDSWAERMQVENAVMTVPGVADIRDELDVSPSGWERGPGEIAEEIEARLRWDVRVDDSLINVLGLDGGRVVLSGTVGSLAEKRHAERLARVAGVTDVSSTQLRVEPWAKNTDLRRDEPAPPSDQEITAAIVQALSYDPRVLSDHVAVAVNDRTPRLSGTVRSIHAKYAAEQDARNTTGVKHVLNELSVESSHRGDSVLQDIITNALQAYGLAESNQISVQVSDGIVTLTGDTSSSFAHWKAEDLSMAVRGVRDVQNKMTIDGQSPVALTRLYGFPPQPDRIVGVTGSEIKTDREIYRDVTAELFWSPFVDSDDVEVEVDDGTVTLTGEVDSSREYEAARQNAFEGGALTVDNRLVLADR